MSETTTFIYALCEPYPNQSKLRYVGKADNPYDRYEAHMSAAARGEKSHKANWIRELAREGKIPQLEVIEEIPKAGWQEIEREYIRVLRAIGFKLTNTTAGGDGLLGFKFSQASRAKMSASAKKRRDRKPSMLGRKHTAESREKMSAARRGEKSYWFGKTLSAEAREKIAAARRGTRASAETRAKMSAKRHGENNSFFRRTHSEESLAKMRVAHLGRKHTPETRAKMRAAQFARLERQRARV